MRIIKLNMMKIGNWLLNKKQKVGIIVLRTLWSVKMEIIIKIRLIVTAIRIKLNWIWIVNLIETAKVKIIQVWMICQ